MWARWEPSLRLNKKRRWGHKSWPCRAVGVSIYLDLRLHKKPQPHVVAFRPQRVESHTYNNLLPQAIQIYSKQNTIINIVIEHLFIEIVITIQKWVGSQLNIFVASCIHKITSVKHLKRVLGGPGLALTSWSWIHSYHQGRF